MELFKFDYSEFSLDESEIAQTFEDMVKLDIAKPPYLPFALDAGRGYIYEISKFIVDEHIIDFDFQIGSDPHGRSISSEVIRRYDVDHDLEESIFGQVVTLIVALATRGVDKERTENKRSRLGIGKRRLRKYGSITYVKVPRINVLSVHGESKCTIRAHFRRGHIRLQHYGHNNELVRRIWIEPCFVNGDGEYINRTAYKVRSSSKQTAEEIACHA